MDTKDGVVEYYPPRDISKMLRHFHLEIEGARIVDGKLKLTVKKPVQFENRGTYDENGAELKSSNKQDKSSLVRSGCASEFDGLYEGTLRSTFIDKLQKSAGLMVRALNKVIGGISGYTFEDIFDLDGWDCVGFDCTSSLTNRDLKFSIYTNPEVVVRGSDGNWTLLDVKSNGYGIDIYNGNDIIGHIDCSLATWEKDIDKELPKYISTPIIPLEEMDMNDFDNLVYPLYKRLADTANAILNVECNTTDVLYLDGYDCVGIEFENIDSSYGKLSISIISNGLLHYQRTGKLGMDIGIDLHFRNPIKPALRIEHLKSLEISGIVDFTDDSFMHIQPKNLDNVLRITRMLGVH